MSFEIGFEVIEKAYHMEDEKKLYQRWIVGYEKEMSFSDFKEALRGNSSSKTKYTNKSEKEILADVKAILEMR